MENESFVFTRIQDVKPGDVVRTGCPNCKLFPPYRRRLNDPWDVHIVCIDCGHDYTNNGDGLHTVGTPPVVTGQGVFLADEDNVSFFGPVPLDRMVSVQSVNN